MGQEGGCREDRKRQEVRKKNLSRKRDKRLRQVEREIHRDRDKNGD